MNCNGLSASSWQSTTTSTHALQLSMFQPLHHWVYTEQVPPAGDTTPQRCFPTQNVVNGNMPYSKSWSHLREPACEKPEEKSEKSTESWKSRGCGGHLIAWSPARTTLGFWLLCQKPCSIFPTLSFSPRKEADFSYKLYLSFHLIFTPREWVWWFWMRAPVGSATSLKDAPQVTWLPMPLFLY